MESNSERTSLDGHVSALLKGSWVQLAEHGLGVQDKRATEKRKRERKEREIRLSKMSRAIAVSEGK